jgi:hypothetical protein
MEIGHDGLLLVCGVCGSSLHYQIACHVHYLVITLHFELEFTSYQNLQNQLPSDDRNLFRIKYL